MTNESSINKTEVVRWSQEAQITLERAQKLCTNAQSYLHITSNELLIHLPDIMDAMEFLYDSLTRQHEMILKIVESLKRQIKSKIDVIFQDFTNRLDPAVEKLNDIISQLKNTSVPLFLLKEEDTKNKCLQDFISMDSINLLSENINIYKSNCKKLRHVLLTSFEKDILEPNMKMNKSYIQIKKKYELLLPLKVEINQTKQQSQHTSESTIGTILRENSSLENELVSLLQMLTNHYDQCMKAVELISSGSTTGINLQVLQLDVEELPEVSKDLNSVYEIILKNQERSNKYLNNNRENIESIIKLLKQDLQLYRHFKTTSFPKFLILFQECEKQLQISSISTEDTNSTCTDLYVQVVEELSFHYSQFLTIFKTKYLAELYHQQYTYPRKFLKRLTELLNEDLYRIQLEETERRRNWTGKYGDFIPKEFNLPGESELPIIVQILTEGLENIQKNGIEAEFNEGKEKELLNLIKRTKQQPNV
ncbi:Autophagy-related protein 17 [Spathaspora sp. JA1]|nr:Autophagy-related protein 17 [Spathaspora sp. JA1]